MTDPTPLDSAWIAAHPAPVHASGTTKNSRGRVLAIGGARMVPGAIRLVGEAALRVGCGKLQLATIASGATMLGMLIPEAAVIALPEDEDGEIAWDQSLCKAVADCDALVLGPGVSTKEVAEKLIHALVGEAPEEAKVVLDAQAVACAGDLAKLLAPFRGRLVMTPHEGEMASLTGRDMEEIKRDPAAIACEVAARFGAVVALKGSQTHIASPEGEVLHFLGGGTGLATGGSGDVLAGAVAGLLSRGASPMEATGWGVWLHGQAGRRMAGRHGPIGFLARELPAEFPLLLPQ